MQPDLERTIRECVSLTEAIAFHRGIVHKASVERAELIAVLTDAGMTTREVGERLNISGARVTQILNLRKWGRKTGGVT